MIEPKILKGTRDFGPADMAKRNFVKDTIRGIFESFGYDPIETPVIEYAETILGKYGEEGDKLTYSFKDNGDRDVALRYDQTVPFARYFAANHGALPQPFKRYEINRVWRADKPQKGRYREFYQCDVDIIGTDSILAELELVKIMVESLQALGFGEFVIKVNDRKLINSILEKLEISEELFIPVVRIIDKLDKIGLTNVVKEFVELGLSDLQVKKLEEVLSNAGDLSGFKDYYTETLDELFTFVNGTPLEQFVKFDMSLARGLDYYTGIIFEAIIPNTGLGSVAGGGRYANLCGSFSKQSFSGVGIALGFDRLVDAMEIMGLFKEVKTNSQVLVTIFNTEFSAKSVEIYDQLRSMGINTEIYFETDEKLGKQIKFADRKGIPFVVVIGPEELEKGIVQLKDMQSGESFDLSLEELTIKLESTYA